MAAAYKKAMASAGNLTAKEQNDLKQDQLDWIKYRVAECAVNPRSFGEPIPKGAPCIAEQYKLRTAALELFAAQAGRGPDQRVNPTGRFELFGICLSCGGSTLEFLTLPNGAIKFSVEANNGKNLGSASGDIQLANKEGIYNDADSDCKLTFEFTHATVSVEQKGDCGFGFGVHADGFYVKTSNAVPKFE